MDVVHYLNGFQICREVFIFFIIIIFFRFYPTEHSLHLEKSLSRAGRCKGEEGRGSRILDVKGEGSEGYQGSCRRGDQRRFPTFQGASGDSRVYRLSGEHRNDFRRVSETFKSVSMLFTAFQDV